MYMVYKGDVAWREKSLFHLVEKSKKLSAEVP